MLRSAVRTPACQIVHVSRVYGGVYLKGQIQQNQIIEKCKPVTSSQRQSGSFAVSVVVVADSVSLALGVL